jgi:WD40 repeat protein/RecA/RadA recombinase
VRETLVPAIEADGYTTVLDVADFTPAVDLLDQMEQAGDQARLTVAVVDRTYADGGMVAFECRVSEKLLAVVRDPGVEGIPDAAETVHLVETDDPVVVVDAVHKLVRRVFVLAAREDGWWVEGVLVRTLESSGVSTGHSCQLEPGDVWSDPITHQLVRADRVVVVLSHAYIRDLPVRAERIVGHVEATEKRRRLVPLQLDADIEVPARYRSDLRIDATREELWTGAIAELCAALEVEPRPIDPRLLSCPYPGMLPFTAEQDGMFFGRDDEIELIVSGLRRQRFVAVIGPSASGKSSLALAGVGARVAERGLDGGAPWHVEVVRPGQAPVTELEAALARWRNGELERPLLVVVDQLEAIYTPAATGGDESASFESSLERMVDEPLVHVLVTVRADFYPQLMSGRIWSLVNGSRVELVPLTGDSLREAIRAPARTRRVVIEDALVERLAAETEGQPGLLPFLQETLVTLWSRGLRYWVLTLAAYERLAGTGRGSGVQQAIQGVAESALVEVTRSDGRARGEDGERIVRNILVRLVQLGEDRQDTRRRLPVAELETTAPDVETFRFVFGVLTDKRLVTTDTADEGSEVVADLGHEAAIRGWPRLSRWIDESRTAEGVRRKLLAQAKDWEQREASGHPGVGLLESIDLASARSWLDSDAARDLSPEPLVERYVQASTVHAERTRRRRRLAAIGVVCGLLLVAATLAVAAVMSRRAQRDAERASEERLALQLRAASAEFGDEDLPLRALLVRTADHLDATSVSRAEMLATVERQRLIVDRVEPPKGVGFDALWVDDARVVAGDGSGLVTVWPRGPDGIDRSGGRTVDIDRTPLAMVALPGTDLLAIGGGDGSPEAGAFAGSDGAAFVVDLGQAALAPQELPLTGDSPVSALATHGDSLVIGRWDGTVTVVDPRGGASAGPTLEVPPTPAGAPETCAATDQRDDRKVRSLAVDYSGRWLAAGTNNCLVLVWDLTAIGAPPQVLLGHADKVRALSFVPSTTMLLSAGDDRSIRRWDVGDVTGPGAVLTASAGDQRVVALCVAPDGSSVVTSGRDHRVRRWTFDGTDLTLDPRSFAAHDQTVRALACPSPRQFASLGADGLVMWDLDRPSRVGDELPIDGALATGLDVRPGAEADIAIATTSETTGSLMVERSSGGRSTVPLGTTFPQAVAYSRDGRYVAVAGDAPVADDRLAGATVVFDAATLEEESRRLADGAPTMRAIAVVDGGNHAAGDDDGGIHLRVDGAEATTRTESGFGVRSLAYTPGGQLLVGDEFGALYCLDPDRPDRPSGRADLGRAVAGIAVANDGTVVAGTADGFVAVFVHALDPDDEQAPCDPASWVRVDLAIASEAVTSVALISDGTFAAVGTIDGNVELWDVVRRRQIGVLVAGDAGERVLAANHPDGSTIATAAGSAVVAYELDRDTLRRQLCELAGRELTADELAAFLPDPGTREVGRCSRTGR